MKTIMLLIVSIILLCAIGTAHMHTATYPSNVCASNQHIASYAQPTTVRVLVPGSTDPQVVDIQQCVANH